MDAGTNELLFDVIKGLGYCFISSISAGWTFYKGWVYYVDRQVKSDTEFIDTRITLLLKKEKEELKELNEKLTRKIETLENNYHKLNEDSLKDMREFMKNFK